ncbi:NAD(P)-binding protein, partial [Thiomicrospira sp.]
MKKRVFDVVIVGGGISGCALTYTLAKYSGIKSIAVLE